MFIVKTTNNEEIKMSLVSVAVLFNEETRNDIKKAMHARGLKLDPNFDFQGQTFENPTNYYVDNGLVHIHCPSRDNELHEVLYSYPLTSVARIKAVVEKSI